MNCSPHARLFPASPMFAATLAVASTKKTAYRPRMPEVQLKNFLSSLPDCAQGHEFKPQHSKTQGIRFRMSPPTNLRVGQAGGKSCSPDGKPGVVSVAISGSSRDGNVTLLVSEMLPRRLSEKVSDGESAWLFGRLMRKRVAQGGSQVMSLQV